MNHDNSDAVRCFDRTAIVRVSNKSVILRLERNPKVEFETMMHEPRDGQDDNGDLLRSMNPCPGRR